MYGVSIANLDENIRVQMQEYDSFAKWLSSNDVKIRADNNADR